MLVEGNLGDLRSGIADEDGTLIISGVLKQLLAEVVAEWI